MGLNLQQFYQGKTFIITGGSSGIGKALAIRLVKLGAGVILIARRKALLDEAIGLLQTYRPTSAQVLESCVVDIADKDAIGAAIRGIVGKHEIDYLINNAGIVCCDNIENLSDEQYIEMMNVNYLGTVWAVKAILPYFKSRHKGSIVNVSSLGGLIGCVGYTAYSSSKFAVAGFTEALRNELSGTGIDVALVCPSDVDTPQFDEENKTKPKETKALSGQIELMQADVVADLILKEMAKKKFLILPIRFSGLLLYRLYLWLPSLFRAYLDVTVRQCRERK